MAPRPCIQKGVQQRSEKPRTSVRGAQPIPDSCVGENVLRSLRVGFNFLAKLPDIDPQVLCVGQLIPQFSEQEFVSKYFPCVLHENAQKFVLLRRKLYIFVTDLDGSTDEIDREVTDTEDGPLTVGLELVTNGRSHSGKQLVHPEGLGDVVVCTGVERLDLAGLVAATG
jgi:hypothetical protein